MKAIQVRALTCTQETLLYYIAKGCYSLGELQQKNCLAESLAKPNTTIVILSIPARKEPLASAD